MSVIRPPWISKSEFYHMPYNFCNRWCERCQLHEYCAVFQEGEKDKNQTITEGKNPNSIEYTFEHVHRNFQKTLQDLLKGTQKWGIDLENIDDNEINNDDVDTEDPIYIAMMILSDRLRHLIKQLEVVPIGNHSERMHESIEVITWYSTLLLPKIARALASQEREKVAPERWYSYDDKTSAFIVYHGLIEVSEALLILASLKLPHQMKKTILSLSSESLNLVSQIPEYFNFEIEKKVS
jgi:hypothetical protein